jgi:hypothetical protein
MAIGKRVVGLIPVLLIGGCGGKIYLDNILYNLPGPILSSPAVPTQKLATAVSVAETLDTYVQPRFHILRDKNFGAFRIVYRRHAGLGQLKVESPREKELIANVNATKRDYAIGLFHCAKRFTTKPRLELLYLNQEAVVTDSIYGSLSRGKKLAAKHDLPLAAIEKKAVQLKSQLLTGKECRTTQSRWEVLMRPVYASTRECVSCHDGSKLGDTLGVMVYAVRKTPRQLASAALEAVD